MHAPFSSGPFEKFLRGYRLFREQYARGDTSIMRSLFEQGQRPDIMMVSCCDSRVDPALILQCDPGDLFIVRNVANIVPPFERDSGYHGTSAALEFGICFLQISHLIILGHSRCGGILSLVRHTEMQATDFISNWVSILAKQHPAEGDPDAYAKAALHISYRNCLTFPWIRERVESGVLKIHLWFFEVEHGEILTYSPKHKTFLSLLEDGSSLHP